MTLDPIDSAPEQQRVGAYALVRRGGRILLSRMSAASGSPGRWTLPGGGVQHGEDPEAAVQRELFEETGLHGRVGSVLGVHSNVYVGPSTGALIHGIRLVYEVIADGAPRPAESGSSDEARWFDVDVAAGLDLSEHARYALALR